MRAFARTTSTADRAPAARRPAALATSRAGAHTVHRLQRTIGNRAVGRLLRSGVEADAPGSRRDDACERQADAVAERIVRGGAPEPSGGAPSPVPARRQAGADPGRPPTGGGRVLPGDVRAFFEPRLGRDLSDVRVHTGGDAARTSAALSARAFTFGRDIYFGRGEFDPGSGEGRRLLAHELTHVLQQEAAGAARAIQRQEAVEVEIVEVPEHPGTVEDIATDSLRTIRAILGNLNTALDNFETAISNESAAEAAPKDALLIAMEQVAEFTIDQLAGAAGNLVPGGGFAADLLKLGRDISKKIREERQRSAAAMARNEAANFIIGLRRDIAAARTALETGMTEDIVAVRRRHAAASEGQRRAIRLHQLMENDRLTRLARGQYSADQLFLRLIERWINNTTAPGRRHESRVYIKLDDNWDIIQVYLQAPFGSRLAEQIRNIGPLQVQNLDVPRVVIWYPLWHQGDRITNVAADIPPEGGRLQNLRSNITGRHHIQEFVRLIRTRPIPGATNVRGETAAR